MNNYPDYIMEYVRQRFDLEYNNTSMDDEINDMDANEVFEHVCNWDGLIGYADEIKSWVRDIYGVDLNDYS